MFEGGVGWALIGISAAALIGALTVDGNGERWRDRRLGAQALVELTIIPLIAVILSWACRQFMSASAVSFWVILSTISLLTIATHSLALGRLRRASGSRIEKEILTSAAEPATFTEYASAIELAETKIEPESLMASTTFDLLNATRSRVVADYRSNHRSDGRVAYGWSQFLGDDSVPSSIGSAYGLRLLEALEVHEAEFGRSRILETIIAGERPDGGWSARSQRGARGHPEVTAWILPVLLRTGLDEATTTKKVQQFEALMGDSSDRGLGFTTVVSSCISAIAEVSPRSAMAEPMVRALNLGAIHLENGEIAWGSTLTPSEGVEPSAAHTGRAVAALQKLKAARGRQGNGPHTNFDGLDLSNLPGAVSWLNRAHDMTLFNETISRVVPAEDSESDLLTVGHFTPAWVARGILASEPVGDVNYLREIVRLVLASQVDGIWRWPVTGVRPIWMTYQGVAVMKEYSLRNLPWPP